MFLALLSLLNISLGSSLKKRTFTKGLEITQEKDLKPRCFIARNGYNDLNFSAQGIDNNKSLKVTLEPKDKKVCVNGDAKIFYSSKNTEHPYTGSFKITAKNVIDGEKNEFIMYSNGEIIPHITFLDINYQTKEFTK
jgi:hypothetical protein